MTAKKSKMSPDRRRKYDDALKAEALRLATESRSMQAAACQLGISHYIAYYNAGWRHSALGYLANNHFATHLQTTSQRCPA